MEEAKPESREERKIAGHEQGRLWGWSQAVVVGGQEKL